MAHILCILAAHDAAAANRELTCRFTGCSTDALEPCSDCRICYCAEHMDHTIHSATIGAEEIGVDSLVEDKSISKAPIRKTVKRGVGKEADDKKQQKIKGRGS